MKKIAIIYHSGVGNTKKVSKQIYNQLSVHFTVDLFSVEDITPLTNLDNYDGFVIGFPVIHTHPSKRILEFIKKIDKLPSPKATYLFTTCAWYSANTLRIFAKLCINKNLIPVILRVFLGCPATDGTLLFPFIKTFFTFPKNLDHKIIKDCNKLKLILKKKDFKQTIPRFKLYSILNYPNKLVGQCTTASIYNHHEACNKCGKCINNCPAMALILDKQGYPILAKSKCEKCYRCIHHCQKRALSLSKKRIPKKVLG